ncbi:uncharacterized protein BO97DRAFT_418237 [Aspergillus homomorphus CBS 101889]|uniref:Uncharacterized protein n=1 Tax=Aspergillus homomorphus (strain CBS 101889) TaxID=1450537 RepID=A0A395HJJ3_ASPHC|nr:hypothetical protein BO97DRAFT_418237 [Aspergillus homomorphus CBS 101889]RAL07796.1 hypothetical protein BO97DRAFT_418237 [Aspergillus homomorphus CBS 101889]
MIQDAQANDPLDPRQAARKVDKLFHDWEERDPDEFYKYARREVFFLQIGVPKIVCSPKGDDETVVTRLVDFLEALTQLPEREFLDKVYKGPSSSDVYKKYYFKSFASIQKPIPTWGPTRQDALNTYILTAQLIERGLLEDTYRPLDLLRWALKSNQWDEVDWSDWETHYSDDGMEEEEEEEEDDDDDEDMPDIDFAVAIAHAYIVHAGITIYTRYPPLPLHEARKNVYARARLERQRAPGPFYSEACETGGKPGYSIERWRFWKQQITELGLQASPECLTLATEAVARRNEIEVRYDPPVQYNPRRKISRAINNQVCFPLGEVSIEPEPPTSSSQEGQGEAWTIL